MRGGEVRGLGRTFRLLSFQTRPNISAVPVLALGHFRILLTFKPSMVMLLPTYPMSLSSLLLSLCCCILSVRYLKGLNIGFTVLDLCCRCPTSMNMELWTVAGNLNSHQQSTDLEKVHGREGGTKG